MRRLVRTISLVPLFSALALAGCSDDASSGRPDTGADVGPDSSSDVGPDTGSDTAPIESQLDVAGTYVDDFGSVHRLSDDTYIVGWAPNETVVDVTLFDNDAGWLVGQNAGDHPFNPDKWSRLEWTVVPDAGGDSGELYVCQSVFAADTEADALDAERADPTDPASGGCGGGFPWSRLTEGQGDLAIAGSYRSDIGFLVVDGDGLYSSWRPTDRTHTLERYDNAEQLIVAQNGPDDPFNPDLWSRFDWTYADDGTLYWCQSAFGADTAEAAFAVTTADRSDPASGGCGGSFPWSPLTPDQGAIAVGGAWGGSGHDGALLSPSGLWTLDGATFSVDSFDNVTRTAIAENGAGNDDLTGLFSRFDWVFVEATLYLCHTVGDAVDAETAALAPAADDSSPAAGGCNGAAFTALVEEGALADTVVGSSASPDDLERAVNGVRGGGANAGGTDVYSLTYANDNDSLTLTWSGRRVVNGQGDDFVVFENPFLISGGPNTFMDPIVVEVSNGGEEWVAFPHDYLAGDETVYSASPFDWWGFAGLTPVLLHEDDNPVSPFDSAAAGGDGFDLDELPEDGVGASIRERGFTHVRLVAAATVTNPDTGAPFVRDAAATGPDIDGVYARYVEPDTGE